MEDNNKLSLSDSDKLREDEKLLKLLLKDQTTGENIKWATDSYLRYGSSFRDNKEIKTNLITGWYQGFIRPRVDKDLEAQLERQRNKAEVFTPSWIIKLQVDAALEDMKELSLIEFIKTKWLEITCGEAPYMVNRYDMETGDIIPLKDRAGFIDNKFKRLNKEIETENEWTKLAIEIYKASYGYEYQGDSLLLARENLILTFFDNYFYMFGAFPDNKLIYKIAKIISLNVFQMDGLSYEIPYSDGGDRQFGRQLSMFEEIEVEEEIPKLAELKLWDKNTMIEFKEIIERNDESMKFDVVIGNPPYQMSDNDSGKGSAKPLYHHFINASIQLNPQYVSLIVPSVWFTGGKGLNEFREKMLSDKRLKKIVNYQTSQDVFPGVNLRGGVNYFIWDSSYNNAEDLIEVTNIKNNEIIESGFRPVKLEKLDIFIASNNGIRVLQKIKLANNGSNFETLYDHVSIRNPFGFPTTYKNHEKFKSSPSNLSSPIKMYASGGKIGYIEMDTIEKNKQWIDKWKVITPFANNIGTDLPDDNLNTIIAGENSIVTETYLVIGADLKLNKDTAVNLSNYLQSKFVRFLISLAKANQNGTRKTYRFVPLQDFTEKSDIDWTKSMSEIDQELYKKYNLSEEEIDFIETNVKEME